MLFNAHAGVWARFTIDVRRQLATAAGLSRTAAARQVRVVFAKVAEFQTRGVVHVHAIVRLDGAHGPGSAPPPWATARRLETAIRHATRTVRVPTPASRNTAARMLRSGRHIDIRRITARDGDLSETVVARYVAKYATKSTEAAGIDVIPLHCRACAGAGAWAAARTHDPEATRRALDAVDDAYDQRAPTIAEPEWVYWLNRTEIDVMAARCLIELGTPSTAEPLLPRALASYNPAHAREVALYQAWLAEGHARAGDLDAARAILDGTTADQRVRPGCGHGRCHHRHTSMPCR